MRLAIIGGSGAARLLAGRGARPLESAATPWGEPSGSLLCWRTGPHEVYFLPRHGPEASIPPHAVNYRANLWLLQRQGVDHVLGINAVGGIHPDCTPGRLVLPDQLIDYTWGRLHSFAGTTEMSLRHVDFTQPFSRTLRAGLVQAADRLGIPVIPAGVYGVTQGPRLESAAEIDRLERDGCSIVGMTAMPEAGLARELGLSYAICCAVVNHAAGRGPPGTDIHSQMAAVLDAAFAAAGRLIDAFLGEPARQ